MIIFLIEKGLVNIETLVVKGDYFKSTRHIDNSEIFNQIKLISELDQILTDYSKIAYTRINSTIGKRVENYKVELRKLKVDLEYRQSKIDINEVDNFLITNGQHIINQGYESLKKLDDIDYIGIIRRSMDKEEICLGRTDESNLKKSSVIEVGKIKNVSYNLIEEDAYSYLKKIQRRDRSLNLENYIEEFIKINKLNKDSSAYINILLNIPSDTMKQWMRYKEGKRKYTLDDQLKIFVRTLEYEKINL